MEAADSLVRVMRRFPSGVAVVTVDTGSERLGLTVGSLVSLSLEPPLVGVAIARQAALHELLREARGFTASLLAADQDGLAQHFARGVPPIALWHGIPLAGGERRAPRLAGALGWLDCALVAEHAVGDHTLFVGEVEAAEEGGGAASPLVHVRQRFQPLGAADPGR